MEDHRRVGKSYGYVMVPQGGLQVAGMKFEEGPRAAGKTPNGGWYRLLVDAGCPVITQAEYEDELQHSNASQSLVTPTEETGQEEENDDRTGHDDGNLPATRNRKPKRRAVRNRRRAAASPAGASAGDDGVPGN